jgi:two-component system response regulator FixJ
MPKRSGLEILKIIQARHYWTPIFLMSTLLDNPIIADALKSGAQDYLNKPFDRCAPVQRVRQAVELWRLRHILASSVELTWSTPVQFREEVQ